MPVIHFAEIIFPHKLSALEQAWKYVALLSVMHPIALPPDTFSDGWKAEHVPELSAYIQ